MDGRLEDAHHLAKAQCFHCPESFDAAIDLARAMGAKALVNLMEKESNLWGSRDSIV